MKNVSPSLNALKAAKQYLKHEFRKILSEANDPKILAVIDRSVEELTHKSKNDYYDFWQLVSAISEGYKLKSVFRMLSSTKYTWQCKNIALDTVVLTGMSPIIDAYIIEKCKRNPSNFKEAWRRDKQMREDILGAGIKKHPERDHFPIFVFKTDEEKYKVFDGMRRTLLALIDEKEIIQAWVGTEVNPDGQSLIGADKGYFLLQMYKRADDEDEAMKRAVTKIGKEIVHNYRDGKEVLAERIGGWSHDPQISELFKNMGK